MFYISTIIFFATFALSDILSKIGMEEKIINGTPATDGSFFSLVVSVLIEKRHQCGGYVIAPAFVLTAGHCAIILFGNPNNERFSHEELCESFEVYHGSLDRKSGGTLYPVLDVQWHDKHKLQTLGLPYDIAVLTLLNEIPDVTPVALPQENENRVTGIEGQFAGWGFINRCEDQEPPEILRTLKLQVMPTEYCRFYWPEFDETVQFCTEINVNQFLSRGDCGGPFLSNERRILGIASSGDLPNMPSMFSKISGLTEYIDKQMVLGEEKRMEVPLETSSESGSSSDHEGSSSIKRSLTKFCKKIIPG